MDDVVALGELLVDFTFAGNSQSGMRLFEQNPGGAPANVLTALSRLGIKTALIGKVGDDMQGRFLRDALNRDGINTQSLLLDQNYFTTLAFVDIDKDGERSFSFARKPGADNMLKKEEVDERLIREAKIFHIGALSLTGDPSRAATFEALEIARKAGCVISYDPNYRAPLWESKEAAVKEMRSVLQYVDVVKISDEETDLLTPEKDPELAGRYLIDHGVKAVFVTLGGNGACIVNRDGSDYQPAVPGKVIDKNGAGDAFLGGVLYRLCKEERKIEDLSLAQLSDFARFGNEIASLCIARHGAIPSMPTLQEVREKLGENF